MLSAPDKFNAVLVDYLKADVGAKPKRILLHIDPVVQCQSYL